MQGGHFGNGGAQNEGGKREQVRGGRNGGTAGASSGAAGDDLRGNGGVGGDGSGTSGAPSPSAGRGGLGAGGLAQSGGTTGIGVAGATAGGGVGGEGAAETGGTDMGGATRGGSGSGGSGPFAEAGAGGAVTIFDWDYDPSACDGFTCGHGVCVRDGTVQHCECKQGYSGERCEDDVDECQQNPCSGACTNTIGSFECECPSGFAGTECERRAFQGIGELAVFVGSSFVALSRDGTHLVATAGSNGSRRAVLFNVETGTLTDVSPAGAVDCEATAINGDGTKVFGHCDKSFIWFDGSARFLEGELAEAEIRSVSADGSVLVGSSPYTLSPYKTAFRATEHEFRWLGVWGQRSSSTRSVSADGSIVVLSSNSEGYVWSTRDGLRRLVYGPDDIHQPDFS